MSRISDNQMTGIIGQVLEIDRDFQPTRPEQIGVGRQDAATSPPPNQASVKDIDHSEQAYAPPPPSTAGETARLDVQHGLWARTLCGRLSISPLDNERIHRVLDIGAGTGLWAMDFARTHGLAKVVATDIAELPKVSDSPENCLSVTHDIESEWDGIKALSDRFDFIHGRMLCYAIRDWQKLVARCWNHLTPGGWIEIQDITMPIRCADPEVSPANSSLLKGTELIQEALRKTRGLDTTVMGQSLSEMLEDQGFVNVKRESIQWAYGDWPNGKLEKEIGTAHLEGTVLKSQDGLSQRMFKMLLGWDQVKAEEFTKDMRKDTLDPTRHFYHQLYVWMAQKPL